MIEGSYQLGLSDLLDQNISCYEYFHSLPKELQVEIQRQDFGSLEEIQQYVAAHTDRDVGPVVLDRDDYPLEGRR